MTDTFVKSRPNESVEEWHKRCDEKIENNILKKSELYPPCDEGEVYIDGKPYPLSVSDLVCEVIRACSEEIL